MSTPRYIRAARRMSLGECDSFGRTADDEEEDFALDGDDFDPPAELEADDYASDKAADRYQYELDCKASQ